jgi:endoglucanase
VAAHLSRRSVVAISVSSAVAFVAIVVTVFSVLLTGGKNDPFSGRELFVWPDSTAARALPSATDEAQRIAFEKLATTPSAIWVTPEDHPVDEVESFVTDITTAAAVKGALPTLVVYGIPDRDCSAAGDGGASAGGTSEADYPTWVANIAAGIADRGAVVILEPDSLALAPDCGNTDARVAQLDTAITALQHKNTTIYLDGGHSSWRSPEQQAELLNAAGVDRVRGFASNVSNFNTTADEIAYDEKVSALTGGAAYVIDTSRNGNGSNGQWCNPSGRRIGSAPAETSDAPHHDANLWIKTPGESDGECNGGPAAGTWWPEQAVELAG